MSCGSCLLWSSLATTAVDGRWFLALFLAEHDSAVELLLEPELLLRLGWLLSSFFTFGCSGDLVLGDEPDVGCFFGHIGLRTSILC